MLERVDIKWDEANIELRVIDVFGAGRLWFGNEIEPDNDS